MSFQNAKNEKPAIFEIQAVVKLLVEIVQFFLAFCVGPWICKRKVSRRIGHVEGMSK